MKTKLAHIQLFPNRFLIEGPIELVLATEMITTNMADQDSDEIKNAMMEMWTGWHVFCSLTGEPILLCDLKYWDVEKNLKYARPDLISQT
jgi:hypothetical protein